MSPATATTALSLQTGLSKAPSDTQHGTSDIDVSKFLLHHANALSLDMDIAGSITDGNIERAIDGASTIDITVRDARRVLLESAIWDYTIEVEFDDNWFRLVQVGKTGDDLTLTFEDRVANWLRQHKKALKVSRNKMTRAEFIQMMVTEIKADNKAGHPLHFFSPELHKKQPISKPKTEADRRSSRDGGLSNATNLKIKGNKADGTQIKNLERILDVGVHLGANRKVLLASIVTAIQESTVSTGATNGTHVGIFQQNNESGSIWRQLGGASRDVEDDATAFFKQAIKADAASPSLTVGNLAEKVQGSGQGSLYGPHLDEAKKILDEYGGGSGTVSRDYAKQYQFTRGQPGGPKDESSWDAARRLADEVQWRFFVVGNTVYYMSDKDLLKSKPIMTIDEDSDGIEGIDFDWDTGKKINEATITCRASRWFANPGEVIVLKDTLGPAKGRWIVSRIRRSLFSSLATITVVVPVDQKKEPAPELSTSSSRIDTTTEASSGRLLVDFGNQAERMGLTVSECDAPGAPDRWGPVHQVHARDSLHYKHRAFDAGGADESKQHAYCVWLKENHQEQLEQLIHNPGFAIYHGKVVDGPGFYGAKVWAQHANHVHVGAYPQTNPSDLIWPG